MKKLSMLMLAVLLVLQMSQVAFAGGTSSDENYTKLFSNVIDQDGEGGKLTNMFYRILDLLRLFGIVAIIVAIAVGAVMMGMKQAQGLFHVIWALVAGVVFWAVPSILLWVMSANGTE